jgi:hypothetical protein
MEKPTVGEIYRHKKGGMYKVLGLAVHTETNELLVIYSDIYATDGNTWARPLKMFMDGRFTRTVLCSIFDGK